MSDLIDVLSESGLRTGETLPRAEVHRLGKRHRAVHLYVFNSKNEVLLQRRSLTVDHAPGRLGISVVGHVDAGESSSGAAGREVEEELGMSPSSLKIDFLFSYFQEVVLDGTYTDRQFNDVYATRADIRTESIRFDRSEVSGVEFAPFEDFLEMALDGSSGFTSVYARECRDLAYFLGDLGARNSR